MSSTAQSAVVEVRELWQQIVGEVPGPSIIETFAEYAVVSPERFATLREVLERSAGLPFKGINDHSVFVGQLLRYLGEPPKGTNMKSESTAAHSPVKGGVTAE